MLRAARIALWVAVAVVAAAFLYLSMRPVSQQPTIASAPVAMVQIGAPFTLIATDGQKFGSKELAGIPYALFFGFTHCPDVCPTTLARLTKLRAQLGKGDDAFRIVLVTVDPARDTPEALKTYASLFGSPVVALTGSEAQIGSVLKSFSAEARKVGSGEDYTMEHTATVFLMDDKGAFRATMSPEEGDQPALEKLASLVG